MSDEPEHEEQPDVEIKDEPLPPITAKQWARILKDERPRRDGKKFMIVIDKNLTESQRLWAQGRLRYCLSCKHTPMVHGDPRRAWCVEMGVMRGDAYPVLCPSYEPKPAK